MEEQKKFDITTTNNQALEHRLELLLDQINMRTQELIRLKMENGNAMREMEQLGELEKIKNQSEIQIA